MRMTRGRLSSPITFFFLFVSAREKLLVVGARCLGPDKIGTFSSTRIDDTEPQASVPRRCPESFRNFIQVFFSLTDI